MLETSIPRPPGFTRCYGCGPDNERGLALEFDRDGEAVVARLTPSPEHGGYGRLVHGGVTATLVDEAFGWALFALLGKIGMTTEMTLTFHAPLRCGEPLMVRGTIEHSDARTAIVRAEIHHGAGKLAATGTGTLRFVSQRAVERIGGFSAG